MKDAKYVRKYIERSSIDALWHTLINLGYVRSIGSFFCMSDFLLSGSQFLHSPISRQLFAALPIPIIMIFPIYLFTLSRGFISNPFSGAMIDEQGYAEAKKALANISFSSDPIQSVFEILANVLPSSRSSQSSSEEGEKKRQFSIFFESRSLTKYVQDFTHQRSDVRYFEHSWIYSEIHRAARAQTARPCCKICNFFFSC